MSEIIDVTAIYDSNLEPILTGCEYMEATINEQAEIFTHPLETGTKISDHKILMPIEIDIVVYMPADVYREAYQQIKGLFRADNTFVVQTKTDAYKSMALAGMPHEERPEMFDLVPMRLAFTQAIFVSTQFQALPASKVRNKRDASTMKKGQQQEGGKSSIAYDLIYKKPTKKEG